MLRLLRPLTPGLLALCHLGVAQAARTAPPDTGASAVNKAASSSSDERQQKKGEPPRAQLLRRLFPRTLVLFLYGLILLLSATSVIASGRSTQDKKPITPAAYDEWRSIESPVLSDDGKWAAYTLSFAPGRGELVVRSTHRDTEFRILRGYAPEFSADSRFLVSTLRKAVEDPHPGGTSDPHSQSDPENSTLAIITLPEGRIDRIPNVTSFTLSGRYLAYFSEDIMPRATTHLAKAVRSGRTLVVRDLQLGSAREFKDVTAYRFDSDANYLAYLISSSKPSTNGAHVLHLKTGKVVTLLEGAGDYFGLTFDDFGHQIAFFVDRVKYGPSAPRYGIYLSRSPHASADLLVSSEAIPSTMTISVDYGLKFARGGGSLLFALTSAAPAALESAQNAHGAEFELWRWNEPRSLRNGGLVAGAVGQLQLAVYHIHQRRLVRLEHTSVSDLFVNEDANHAIWIDQMPYEMQGLWTQRSTLDAYVFDMTSGHSRLFRRAWQPLQMWRPFRAFAAYSPSGQYLLYYDDKRWWSYDVVRGRTIDLTSSLHSTIQFASEGPLPEGIAGWTQKDRRVLIYDDYDIWEIDPAGTVLPRNLTGGFGRKEHITFRLLRDHAIAFSVNNFSKLLPYEPVVDTTQPLLLGAVDKDTMASGVWRTSSRSDGAPEKLIMLDKRVSIVAHARKAQQYLLRIESFREFPDLWTGPDFTRLQRISDANPQQRRYSWGTEEMLSFTTPSGVPLRGRLYKPDNFEPSKKYPMIVGIYEKEFRFFHQYAAPQPLMSAYTGQSIPTKFVSSGYVVLHPDIDPRAPYPGNSAVDAVTSAVHMVIEQGFVDESRICLSGHSYGGYEVAYILTQSQMFRCAVIGAPVVNTISHYGRAPEDVYFDGQLRHGGSVWERPFVYLVNSPLFHIDRTKTPILILHNDEDTTIPIDQGKQLFMALRRSRTEAYLFNYLGEGHGLTKYTNRLDWDMRVSQFFDHFLKGDPRPDWMQQ